MIISILFLFLGFIALIIGSEFLIKNIVKITQKYPASKIFIGVFILGIGTSVPEIFTSIISSINNHNELSIANLFGSNLCNVFVGATLIILFAHHQKENFSLFDIFYYLLSSLIFLIIITFSGINFIVSIILIIFIAVYIIHSYKINYSSKANTESSIKINFFLIIICAIAGFSLIFLGAQTVIDNSIKIADYLNISTRVIGLTIISLGTSLPEIVLILSALLKKQNTLAFSNLVGSNIINVTVAPAILGLFKSIPKSYFGIYNYFDISIYIFSIIAILVLVKPRKINFLFAIICLCLYIFYLYYLYFRS